MRKNAIAALGDKDSVLIFKALGIDAFFEEEAVAAEDRLKLLARNYKVIFITDELAVKLDTALTRYKSKPFPAIIPLPTARGSNGYGLDGIKKDIEKAIGADILFKS